MENLLSIENLKTHFFTSKGVVKAVDDISFTVRKGGCLGIVGESGSGKSMTALSVLRLVAQPGRIVGGKIIFNGTNLLELPEPNLRKVRGSKISMVFQEPTTSLNPVFTIGNQIEEAIQLHQSSLSRAAQKEKVIESLALVKIADPKRVAKSYPHELSGGMKQRAMIAMALVCRPELLIADEPTSALDVTVQAQVLELLKQLRAELGMALILITHDIGVVAETVEEVVVMNQGKIVEQNSVGNIFSRPQHAYTKRLLEVYEKLARN